MDNNIVFRTQNEHTVSFFKDYGEQNHHFFKFEREWEEDGGGLSRITEQAWKDRYRFECSILTPIIESSNIRKVIELGTGPGCLSQNIISNVPDINYTLIDQPGAKKAFEKMNRKGKFIVKDLMNDFNISDLDSDYDLFMANDFLEHINNPSIIMQNAYKILKDGGKAFISIPNWRTNHTFIYRGLFDWDNFVYFMYTHGFSIAGYVDSPLRTSTPGIKYTTETSMPPELETSWNYYMIFNKRVSE